MICDLNITAIKQNDCIAVMTFVSWQTFDLNQNYMIKERGSHSYESEQTCSS